MKKAYLAIDHKMMGNIPMMRGVSIYSEDPTLMTSSPSSFSTTLAVFEGEDFEEADKKARQAVARVPTWSWMLPWLDNSLHGTQRRVRRQWAMDKATQFFLLSMKMEAEDMET